MSVSVSVCVGGGGGGALRVLEKIINVVGRDWVKHESLG